MIVQLIRLAAAGLALVAVDDASKKDLAHLQGAWKVQSMEQGGKAVDADDIIGAVLTIEGDKYTLAKDGKMLDAGTFTLDATKKPPTLDIQPGRDGAKALAAIYQLDGDVFKEAFALGGAGRPTEVASKEGSGVAVVTFKREKK